KANGCGKDGPLGHVDARYRLGQSRTTSPAAAAAAFFEGSIATLPGHVHSGAAVFGAGPECWQEKAQRTYFALWTLRQPCANKEKQARNAGKITARTNRKSARQQEKLRGAFAQGAGIAVMPFRRWPSRSGAP